MEKNITGRPTGQAGKPTEGAGRPAEGVGKPAEGAGRPTEGVGKYFKYALGEIVLVVIGILIAIQINNWNQAKIVKEKERLAVIEILTDLEYNIGDLESIKSDQVRTVKELETLIVTMESNTPYHDSLGVYFYRTSYYDEVAFKISGYNSLNSIGMDLIEDSKIRSSIGQYFTSSIGDLKGAYQEVVKDFHEYMLPYHRKEFTTINMFKGDRAMIPNNYVVLKNNKEFIQSLKIYHEVQSLYLKTLIGNLDIAILLKQDIEGYINE